MASINKSPLDYCRDFGIETLYHITRLGNVPSILNSGLLSHNKVKEQKIAIFTSSNPEIQEIRAKKVIGNLTANDYVPLFFSNRSPMLWNIENANNNSAVAMVYLCIKPEIIGEKGVYFSDGNVASGPTKCYCKPDQLALLDWNNIWNFNPDKIGFYEAKRIKSAEVLVPNIVSSSWFKKLIVPDEETKTALFGISYNLPIEVNKEFYYTNREQKLLQEQGK